MLTFIRRFLFSSMEIKTAQLYVGGVKKVRLFSLSILFVMISFVLLLSGLFLVHAALFTYSMWSPEVKFIAALAVGGIELLTAVIILVLLFREENWAKFCGIQKVLDSVIKGR